MLDLLDIVLLILFIIEWNIFVIEILFPFHPRPLFFFPPIELIAMHPEKDTQKIQMILP